MGFVPTVPVAFLMLFISMIAWGSWTNTHKKCGDWRFEGFYIDYIASVVAATFVLSIVLAGFHSEGWSPMQFVNNFADNTTSGMLWALSAGLVWGIGNLLLVIAIELAGLAIAFPLGVGFAMVLGTFLSYITNPAATKHPEFLFLGLFLATLGVVANALAYRTKEKANTSKKSLKRGVIIALLTGIFLGLFSFQFNFAFNNGLSGYEGAFFMTIGGFISTAILLPLFMKKPLVPGKKAIGIAEYKRAKPSWHFWAIVGGFLWSVGTVFNLAVAATPNFSVAIAYTLGNCAPMVAAIWGIFFWKEFKGAPRESYLYLILMFCLFIFGILMLAKAAG